MELVVDKTTTINGFYHDGSLESAKNLIKWIYDRGSYITCFGMASYEFQPEVDGYVVTTIDTTPAGVQRTYGPDHIVLYNAPGYGLSVMLESMSREDALTNKRYVTREIENLPPRWRWSENQ